MNKKGDPENLTKRWRKTTTPVDHSVGLSDDMLNTMFGFTSRDRYRGTNISYRMTPTYGLSVTNVPFIRVTDFAWEVAVLDFDNEGHTDLCYTTPLTGDVLVFYSDEETNHFIYQAKIVFTLLEIFDGLNNEES